MTSTSTSGSPSNGSPNNSSPTNSSFALGPPHSGTGVITTAELRRAGLSAKIINARCRPDGPWRRLAPGVVLLARGEPTRHQLLCAAAGSLGQGAVITGTDALSAHGLPCVPPRAVHVLVPTARRAMPAPFTILERTSRMPEPIHVAGVPFAPPARAALDTARREEDPQQSQRLLRQVLTAGLCTLDELDAELRAGSQRGSAEVRLALHDLRRMRSTFVHPAARRMLAGAPFPSPIWDVRVLDSAGSPLADVDAWWDEIALGWQFTGTDSGEADLSALAAGVLVVRTPADRLRTDPAGVLRELAAAFRAAARRPRPRVSSTTSTGRGAAA